MLLKEIKTIFHQELDAIYPKEEVDAFFYRLIEHYLQLERFVLVMHPNHTITKEEEQPLFEALSGLKLEKPLQYITGMAYFMDLELKVNAHVLIPRPETEELVAWIISDYQVEQNRELNILDIGTGSGCIAIALAKNLPNAKVYALDVSTKALEVVHQNATLNNVDVTLVQKDILNPKLDLELKFDIIVSNPPYVRELEKEKIKENVKAYEPSLALFVPDEDALLFYRAIVAFAKEHFSEKGCLYLEINQYLGKETKALLEAHNFSEIELRKDLFGNDRMLKAIKP
ncbi:peptide chain release factor N(5)-glutamine methyltransferase [Flagellimonas hymeniacidonis]|uniref:Release factor glutamine methyltransferase n=1 Tax=Flagellimonas hymeniacidonis TaxID=2603628 RepID=A0A5C8V1F1_9FLAO|nr:peptide chain release factor N(5)-glutamine methyltransferase [Flagellimonas hymeniacidonis]TXN35440.1 peptide chain release factor N(5)-glutamine methyltransferase [Flagellimonas hymeniacidonis]